MVDREGMAAAFLARLAGDGCDVVTVLRADQYAGLASFADVGPFAPFQYDREGTLVRGVAPARFALALPDHPSEHLDLRVALVRDLRAHVPIPHPPGEPACPLCVAGGPRPGGHRLVPGGLDGDGGPGRAE